MVPAHVDSSKFTFNIARSLAIVLALSSFSGIVIVSFYCLTLNFAPFGDLLPSFFQSASIGVLYSGISLILIIIPLSLYGLMYWLINRKQLSSPAEFFPELVLLFLGGVVATCVLVMALLELASIWWWAIVLLLQWLFIHLLCVALSYVDPTFHVKHEKKVVVEAEEESSNNRNKRRSEDDEAPKPAAPPAPVTAPFVAVTSAILLYWTPLFAAFFQPGLIEHSMQWLGLRQENVAIAMPADLADATYAHLIESGMTGYRYGGCDQHCLFKPVTILLTGMGDYTLLQFNDKTRPLRLTVPSARIVVGEKVVLPQPAATVKKPAAKE